MKTKILITGGAGYIGSVLTSKLLDSGYDVTVFDNFMYKQNSLLSVCHQKQLEIIVDDVRNKNALKKQVEKHDIIIPLAAIVGAPACEKDKALATEINQIQIENITNWVSNDKMIIYPVTNSGYGIGTKNQFCTEESPLSPISHYGKTKVKGEKALFRLENAISFRFATVFGSSPRMRMDLLVNDFVYRAFSDRYIILFESHFKRNYIHIRDCSAVFLHAINNFDSMYGHAYNVGLSDANLSKMELCKKIKGHLSDFIIMESEYNEDPDKRDYIVSNNKIESTGWKPHFSIDDGIEELLKLYSYMSVNPNNNL
tara:strand:- start:671 stop:1609 length:939 start_codon:yes stop_codon:yes gene_type:complete